MKITAYETNFILTAESIDEFSDAIETKLAGIGTERQNRMRIRLSFEEALLRMRDRFGEDLTVHAYIGKKYGRMVIEVTYEGEAFNPLSSEENELADLSSSLLSSVGLAPQYTYQGRTGTLKVSLALPGISPGFKMLITILGGALVGLIGKQFLSDAFRTSVTTFFMQPIYDVWVRLLNVMSGPVIFLMVISTTLGIDKITRAGGRSRNVIARYFFLSFAMGFVAIGLAVPVFPLHTSASSSAEVTQTVVKEIQNLIPNNFFKPFMESNTPQLLLLAFVLGAAMNIIGQPVRNLRRITLQANSVGLLLTEWMSRAVPYVACVLFGLEVWTNRPGILSGFALSILLSLAISVLCIAAVMCYVGWRKQVSPVLMLKKTWEPFWLTLKYGSLDASYGQCERSCFAGLGINRSFATMSIPNGLVLYMPISAIGTLVFFAYAAKRYGVTASPIWYVMAVILAVVLFVATPPVPGANLLAYVVLFARMGIPVEALVDAMIFDIIFGIFAAASNQLVMQMDLILQAGKLGLLDRKILQKDKKTAA